MNWNGYYSANDLLALILAIQAVLFWLARRHTGLPYFASISAGLVLASLAWGTWHWQGVGRPLVDWGWFWAQPLFAGGVMFIGVALSLYLPLSERARRVMLWWIVAPQVTYLLINTLLLLLGVEVVRVWMLLIQMPTILAIGVVALACERREPGVGHAVLGVAILSMPVITVWVAASGGTTTVLRFWTGIPLVLVTQTMLTVTLLRDRRLLNSEVQKRREAEVGLQTLNQDLALRVDERTAELREVIEGLESFNRNLSHDLRGPLGGIDMLAFLAQQQLRAGDVAATETQLRLISEQARETQRTLDYLLSLARTLHDEVRWQRVDLDALVESAVRQAEISVVSKAQGRPLPKVVVEPLGNGMADPGLLRLALNNLISNALKFNMDRPDVVVLVRRESSLKSELVITVQDNGIGFDDRHAERLFEPFSRLKTTDMVAGFGLGLNIVSRAVRRMGGQVSVRAKPGGGARFRITIPHADAHS